LTQKEAKAKQRSDYFWREWSGGNITTTWWCTSCDTADWSIPGEETDNKLRQQDW